MSLMTQPLRPRINNFCRDERDGAPDVRPDHQLAPGRVRWRALLGFGVHQRTVAWSMVACLALQGESVPSRIVDCIWVGVPVVVFAVILASRSTGVGDRMRTPVRPRVEEVAPAPWTRSRTEPHQRMTRTGTGAWVAAWPPTDPENSRWTGPPWLRPTTRR